MSDERSDTHGIHQPFVSDGEELSTMLSQKYSLGKPLSQMTVLEFLQTALQREWGMKLVIRRGNTNTAQPSFLVHPGGTLELYISDERNRCGKKQLLYWYFKCLCNHPVPDDRQIIFNPGERPIAGNVHPPVTEDMDEKDDAMRHTKLLLKILL